MSKPKFPDQVRDEIYQMGDNILSLHRKIAQSGVEDERLREVVSKLMKDFNEVLVHMNQNYTWD